MYSPARLSSTFSSLAAVKIRKQFTSDFSLEIPNRLDKMTLRFPQKADSFSIIPLSSSNDISSSDPHVAKVICGRVSTEISDKVIFSFSPTICHLGYAPTC